MKTIAIVLTKYSDWVSNLIYICSGGGYTHASIALNDGHGIMFSFNYKGFCRENAILHKKRGVKRSMCYQLRISNASYQKLEQYIQDFLAHREQYKYSRFGAVMCFLRIPFKRKNHYFCSQFVAEMLVQANAFKLKKAPSLYSPNLLAREIRHSAQLRRIQHNPV